MINDFKKAKRDSKIAWVICIAMAFFLFADFLLIAMENTLKEKIADLLKLGSSEKVKNMVAFPFLLGNWLFVFPAGFALDRYSVRRVSLSALFITLCAIFGAALSTNPMLFRACRFLSGAAHAFCFLACTTLVSRWFSPEKQGFVMGLVIAIGLSGAMVAQGPFSNLVAATGIQQALFCVAGLVAVVLVIGLLTVHDYPSDVTPPSKSVCAISVEKVKRVFANKENWLFSFYTAFLNAFYAGFAIICLDGCLQGLHDFTKGDAKWLSTIFFFGYTVGGPLVGFVSEKWQSRKKPMIVGSLITILLLLVFTLAPLNYWAAAAVLFLLGISIIPQVLSYPSIIASNPLSIASTSMSVASFIVMGSFLFFERSVKKIREIFPEHADQYSLGFLIGFTCLSLVLAAFFLKETYGKGVAEEDATESADKA